MNLAEAKRRVDRAFESLFPAHGTLQLRTLVPETLTAGKLYEAFVLAKIAENLTVREGYQLRLINDNSLTLKTSHGGVNRRYPYIAVQLNGVTIAEIWTDIEFLALSYFLNGDGRSPGRGDFHELDIVVLDPGIQGKPRHDQVWLGVECKNTGYHKGLLKEILGIRRELSYVRDSVATRFSSWPRDTVPADPPSCLLVFSTDRTVEQFASPGEAFGIDFFFEELNP